MRDWLELNVLLGTEDLDEMNIEIMRNTLFKAYLDDFAAFCQKLGGSTSEVMGNLLSFEVSAADRGKQNIVVLIIEHCWAETQLLLH